MAPDSLRPLGALCVSAVNSFFQATQRRDAESAKGAQRHALNQDATPDYAFRFTTIRLPLAIGVFAFAVALVGLLASSGNGSMAPLAV